MASVKNYLSLVRFSHTIFALPFALIGFAIAAREPLVIWLTSLTRDALPSSWSFNGMYDKPLWVLFLLVLFCMVTARSAAMGFNRWLDKSFDAKNPRTAIREIPAGIISANNALMFVIVNSVLFIACTWFINRICFFLSPVALFVILFYSYTKRFTALCHLVLGLGLSLAPIGAYLAVTGHFSVVPVLFSFVVLCWVSGFDIIYALQDVDFDRSLRLNSIPAALGQRKALRVSELLHLLAGLLVIVTGFYASFGWLYWAGTAVFCGMLIYQHSIVKHDDLRRVNLAFMTANGIASVVFAVLVIADLLIHH